MHVRTVSRVIIVVRKCPQLGSSTGAGGVRVRIRDIPPRCRQAQVLVAHHQSHASGPGENLHLWFGGRRHDFDVSARMCHMGMHVHAVRAVPAGRTHPTCVILCGNTYPFLWPCIAHYRDGPPEVTAALELCGVFPALPRRRPGHGQFLDSLPPNMIDVHSFTFSEYHAYLSSKRHLFLAIRLSDLRESSYPPESCAQTSAPTQPACMSP